MKQVTKVAQLSSFDPGEMIAVEVNVERVLVANVDRNIHAVSETCTHAQGQLSLGYLDDQYVECPIHSGIFNVFDGSFDNPPTTEGLRVYQTRVEGDDIFGTPIGS